MQKDFSYPLAVDGLSSAESKYVIKAAPQDLQDLAGLLKVQDVKSFSAGFKVKLDRKKHIILINGDVKASVILQSVISLENFEKKYSNSFDIVFDTNTSKDLKLEEELSVDDDVFDVVVNGEIDLWQVAIEQLALLLDDYPRKDGESFSFVPEFGEDEKKNPFDVLAKLKK